MFRTLRIVLSVALAAGLAVGLSSPAGAMPADTYTWTCFGQTGTFLVDQGNTILDLSGTNGGPTWPDGTRACYGISPGHAIYQIAATSGHWYQIPGNGLADTIDGYAQLDTVKRLCVSVFSTGHHYYDDFYGSSWHGWTLTTNSDCTI